MKTLFTSVVVLYSILALGQHEHHAPKEVPAKKAASPHETAMSNVGKMHLHIDYSSPRVKGRVIWGGLVPYDQVWVTGAHNATSITFSENVVIDGISIAKGTYALFTIPGKDKWTIILNKNYKQHLADDYDPKDDIARITVIPKVLDHLQEELLFEVKALSDTKGRVTFFWERIGLAFDIEVSK